MGTIRFREEWESLDQFAFDLVSHCQWEEFERLYELVTQHRESVGGWMNPFHALCYEGMGLLDREGVLEAVRGAWQRVRAEANKTAPRGAGEWFYMWQPERVAEPVLDLDREVVELGVRGGSVVARGSAGRFPGLRGTAGPAPNILRRQVAGDEKWLRVGFLSGEFGRHVTSDLILALLECFETGGLQPHIFAIAEGVKEVHRKVRKLGRTLTVLSPKLSDYQMACEIARRGVHILVFVGGYTNLSRPGVCVFKPAPVIGSFLAYPGTMGSAQFDFVVLDERVCPEEGRGAFAEKNTVDKDPPPFSRNNCKQQAPRKCPKLWTSPQTGP